jgi:alkanesulfonate monooxygenase SsuD/methylene tetrahydromethanopterin reductase-like flavin-dependent oxidoreductase (luciferase family)
MEFGVLFTSHPNTESESYPHREVHARVRREVLRADEIGFDIAWIAEHHFSNQYGITLRITLGTSFFACHRYSIDGI